MDIKRLFWGFDLDIQWLQLPSDGRIIPEESRHSTAVFLGEVDFEKLKPYVENYKPNISISPSGIINNILFLPNSKRPRVVSLGGTLNNQKECIYVVDKLKTDMKDLGLKVEEREWLLHVTVARAPFKIELWKKWWKKEKPSIQFNFKNICLFESLQGLNYKKLYKYPLS